jgi:DNA polymerase-3 subunit gamma/tau
MSYQVLARKWRPRSFSTLVGQEHVVRALTHALNEQRLHHAYLFTGTRGVGKTTLARILAKSLNCEAGISATPCGVCTACTEIDAGRFVDILEVDAATNTRVEEMRQLLESAIYAPTRGRFKVYVIDEVHMLTNSAFNAMLKTLEEPPEHVKFILATTDPQKIPVTVLSRCLQFNLKQMPPTAIVQHLSRILDAEALPFETPALQMLAHAAAGSMRDALSLLDQAIAHGAGKVETAQVRDMLGTVDSDYLFAILDALLAGDAATLLAIAQDMDGRSLSFVNALQELAQQLVNIQALQCAPTALPDLPERERLQGFAQAFGPEFVQLAYQITVQGRQEIALAPDELAGFTMTLLRLFTFRPESGSGATHSPTVSPAIVPRHVPPIEHKSVSSPALAPTATVVTPDGRTRPQLVVPPLKPAAKAASSPVSEPAALVDSAVEPAPAKTAPVPTPAQQTVAASVTQPVSVTVAAPTAAIETPVASSAVAATNLPASGTQSASSITPADWSQLLARLDLSGMPKNLAHNCELRDFSDNRCLLRLAPEHKHMLMNRSSQDKLQQALSELLQQPVSLKIEVADTEAMTPAAAQQQQQQQQQAAAESALRNDPFVQELAERFDATLVPGSIKPIL